jgi:DNA polymerase-4
MPMIQARRRCPHAEYVPANHSKYSKASKQVMALLRTFSPALQMMSVDEAFLDLTGTERLHGPPFSAATRIRQSMTEVLGFSASIGIASNRLMAKIASELAKPAGILHIYPGQEATILAPLSISALPGVGKVTSARLRGLGAQTIGDIARLPLSVLEANFKSLGVELYKKARGRYSSDLVLETQPKSIGKETTFGEDQDDPIRLEAVLCQLAEQATVRLRRRKMEARGVTLKIRFEDFATYTCAAQMDSSTALEQPIIDLARFLLKRALQEKSQGRKIRLLGVYLTSLAPKEDYLDLFEDDENQRRSRLAETVDALRTRFGEDALVSGRTIGPKKSIRP